MQFIVDKMGAFAGRQQLSWRIHLNRHIEYSIIFPALVNELIFLHIKRL